MIQLVPSFGGLTRTGGIPAPAAWYTHRIDKELGLHVHILFMVLVIARELRVDEQLPISETPV